MDCPTALSYSGKTRNRCARILDTLGQQSCRKLDVQKVIPIRDACKHLLPFLGHAVPNDVRAPFACLAATSYFELK